MEIVALQDRDYEEAEQRLYLVEHKSHSSARESLLSV